MIKLLPATVDTKVRWRSIGQLAPKSVPATQVTLKRAGLPPRHRELTKVVLP